MERVLEALPVEREGKVRAGRHQAIGIGQQHGSEGNRIAYRTAESGMQISDEGDLHQRWPGDTPRDSPGPGLHSGNGVMRQEIVGPLLGCLYRN